MMKLRSSNTKYIFAVCPRLLSESRSPAAQFESKTVARGTILNFSMVIVSKQHIFIESMKIGSRWSKERHHCGDHLIVPGLLQ